MASIDHSTSSSLSNETDDENDFQKALIPDGTALPGSLSKLDYLDTLRSKPSVSNRQLYLEKLADLDDELRQYGSAFESIVHPEPAPIVTDVGEEADLEHRRNYLHKQVLFIIGFHLVLLCLIDSSLQIILANCGNYCPSPSFLYHFELAVVVLLPCLVLIYSQLICCFGSPGLNLLLLSVYSVMFSFFFFSLCDLLVGPTKAHRDITLVLFTLTISFILFSLYIYSKDSTVCLYLSLGILTLIVALAFSLLLLFPALLNKIPHEIESVLVPNVVPKKTSVWMSYVMALLFALASVSLTTLMFTALREVIAQDDGDGDFNPYSRATGVLVRIEMFFVVLPVELLMKLVRRCHSK